MAVLMLSVFTVSIGFGVLLPLLPDLIERLLGAGREPAQALLHATPYRAFTAGLCVAARSATAQTCADVGHKAQ